MKLINYTTKDRTINPAMITMATKNTKHPDLVALRIILKGLLIFARVLSYFPYAPPVIIFKAFLFLPDFVVGIPVARAMRRLAWVIPKIVFTEGLRHLMSFTLVSLLM